MKKSSDIVIVLPDSVSIPKKYCDLAVVFFERAANTLPVYKNQVPLLERSVTPPFSLLYNLSQTKLNLLRDYISDSIAKRFIQSFIFLADVLVFFM